MFGFKKKKAGQDTQIPYQVYETVHEPAARRRHWIVRLIAALVVTTLLVAGIIALRNGAGNGNDQPASSPAQDQPVQQAPQTNAPLQRPDGQPSRAPLSDETNDKTVGQPQ